jgi:hypothetical protein
LIGTAIDLLDETFNTSIIPKDISDTVIDADTGITMSSSNDTNSVNEDGIDHNVTADDVVLLKRSSAAVTFYYILSWFKGIIIYCPGFDKPAADLLQAC